MALDPSISLKIIPPTFQAQDPMEVMGRALSLRHMMQQGLMQQQQMQQQQVAMQGEQLKLEQARRDAADRQRLSEYLSGLAGGGSPQGPVPNAPAGVSTDGAAAAIPNVAPGVTSTAPQGIQRPLGMPDIDYSKVMQFGNVGATFLKNVHQMNKDRYEDADNNLKLLEAKTKAMATLAAGVTKESDVLPAVATAYQNQWITSKQRDELLSHPFDPKDWTGFQYQALDANQRLADRRAEQEQAWKAWDQKHKENMAPWQEQEAQFKAGTAGIEQGVAQKTADAQTLAAAMRQGPKVFAAELAKLPESRQQPFLGAKSDTDILSRALKPSEAITTAETLRHNQQQEQWERERIGISRQEQTLRQKQFDVTYGAMLGPDGKPLDPEAQKAIAAQDPVAVAIANYQLPPPSLARGGQAASTMRKVMALNPTYKADQWQARNATEKEYSPAGKTGQAITSNDTALAHIANISDAGKALKNGDLQFLNKLALEVGAQTGSSPRVVYDAIVSMVAPEISKAVIGGVGGEAERQQMAHNFSSSVNDETREATIGGVVKLLGERYQKTAHAYEAAMERPLPANRLSDASKAMLQRYGVGAEKAAPGAGGKPDPMGIR